MTRWIEGRDPRTGEPTGMYWCLPDPPRLTEAQRAELFSPEANIRWAMHYIRARYAKRGWEAFHSAGARGHFAHHEFEAVAQRFGLSLTSDRVRRSRPPEPFSWAWWRTLGRRMLGEFRAEWRRVTRVHVSETATCAYCGEPAYGPAGVVRYGVDGVKGEESCWAPRHDTEHWYR